MFHSILFRDTDAEQSESTARYPNDFTARGMPTGVYGRWALASADKRWLLRLAEPSLLTFPSATQASMLCLCLWANVLYYFCPIVALDLQCFRDWKEHDSRRKPVASRRRIRKRGCDNKVRYSTRGEATRVAKKMTSHTGEILVPYHCGFCSKWHIGHPPMRVQRQLRYTALVRKYRIKGDSTITPL